MIVKKPASPDYGREVDDDALVDVPTPNARQGVTQQNVRYVLTFGLLGIVIVFGAVYLVYFG